MLKPNAYMLWTVGNRTVGGLQVPTDDILCQLFEQHGVAEVKRLDRNIHFKRMPRRNRASDTMAKETILILRKRALREGRMRRRQSFEISATVKNNLANNSSPTSDCTDGTGQKCL
jgi:hypothetical protein